MRPRCSNHAGWRSDCDACAFADRSGIQETVDAVIRLARKNGYYFHYYDVRPIGCGGGTSYEQVTGCEAEAAQEIAAENSKMRGETCKLRCALDEALDLLEDWKREKRALPYKRIYGNTNLLTETEKFLAEVEYPYGKGSEK